MTLRTGITKNKKLSNVYSNFCKCNSCMHLIIDHAKMDGHPCNYKGCSCKLFVEYKPYKNKTTPCSCAFCWKFVRSPKLGGCILHLVEALADSGAIMLGLGNIPGATDRFFRIRQILQVEIKAGEEVYPRCQVKTMRKHGSQACHHKLPCPAHTNKMTEKGHDALHESQTSLEGDFV